MDSELGIYNKNGGGEKYKPVYKESGGGGEKKIDKKKDQIERLEAKIQELQSLLKKLKENDS